MYDSEGRFIPAKFEEIFTKYVFAAFAASRSRVANKYRSDGRFDKGNKGGLTFREGVHVSLLPRTNQQPGLMGLSGPVLASAGLNMSRSNLLNSHGHRVALQMIHAQRQAVDPIGWCAEAFEWASTYILSKEDCLPFQSSRAADELLSASQSGPRTACALGPFLRHK